MSDPTRGGLRLLRAGGVAVVVVALSFAAHVAGGGHAGDAVVVAAGAVLVLLACLVVAGRRLGALPILALLGVGQLVMHGALSLSAQVACASGGAGAAHGAHGAARAVAEGTAACAGVPVHQVTAAMLLAHVAASLASAALLAAAERSLWALVAWFAPLARVLAVPLLAQARERDARRGVAVLLPHPRGAAGLDVVSRRGPPALLAAH